MYPMFYGCKTLLEVYSDLSSHSSGASYLSSGQENIITYVPHATCNNTKGHTREHIGIVALPWIQCSPVW